MEREPEERAVTCVVTALEGQSIPWVLQQKLIESVAQEIRMAMDDERRAVADLLDLEDASEESLAELKSMVHEMQTGKATSGKQGKSKVAA